MTYITFWTHTLLANIMFRNTKKRLALLNRLIAINKLKIFMLRVYECIQDPNGSISSTCYCPRDQLGDTVRDLIFIISLAFALNGVHADLLVVLLEGSEIFASLGEFTFLHTLTDVPVDESALGVHQIEFVIQTSPGLSDGSGVGQHADSARNLGQITSWDDSRGLVVDTDLKRIIEITVLPFQVRFL